MCSHLNLNGVESHVEQRGTKASFDITTMQALELLQFTKRHISGQSDNEQ